MTMLLQQSMCICNCTDTVCLLEAVECAFKLSKADIDPACAASAASLPMLQGQWLEAGPEAGT